jgi:Gpi18-like mannosyltransferase
LSAFFVYRISAKLYTANAALSVLFFIAMPMVLLVAVSGLTEPLFGFVLVLSVWLFAEKKYLFSMLLLSFLPLVRSEGFVVIPVFILVLLLQKQWKYVPLLTVGGLVYSLAGYIVFDDFFVAH